MLAVPTFVGAEGVLDESGYRIYVFVERVWFQSWLDNALCGAWQ
jgi:hypothetical protein